MPRRKVERLDYGTSTLARANPLNKACSIAVGWLPDAVTVLLQNRLGQDVIVRLDPDIAASLAAEITRSLKMMAKDKRRISERPNA